MTPDDQLTLWVRGIPLHSDDPDQCCPDFSCCVPELLACRDERINFVRLDEAGRLQMLTMFLERMLANQFPDSEVHYHIVEADNDNTGNC